MVSDLNGQETFFTRISVGGLLNARKVDLTHMLLKDINMFHTHPNKIDTFGFNGSGANSTSQTPLFLRGFYHTCFLYSRLGCIFQRFSPFFQFQFKTKRSKFKRQNLWSNQNQYHKNIFVIVVYRDTIIKQ